MPYQVYLSKKAVKNLELLDSKKKEMCFKLCKFLEMNPYAGKKLLGKWVDHYSIRAWPLRIVYRILKKEICIEIVDIGHRKDVYR